MTKKIFTTIIFFVFFTMIIFFIFYSYKYKKNVNTINIQSKEDVEEYILSINEYNAVLDVEVVSNKNRNVYKLKQEEDILKETSIQEILENNYRNLIIENRDKKVIIKNNTMNVEKVYSNYGYFMDNTLFLSTFIKQYKESKNRIIKENGEFYIVEIKLEDNRVSKKVLYINKKSKKIISMEVYDINQNRTIYILYKEIEINKNK